MSTTNYESMGIVELRKASRGKVKGGYTMKKPELITALHEWDRMHGKSIVRGGGEVPAPKSPEKLPVRPEAKQTLLGKVLGKARRHHPTDTPTFGPNRADRRKAKQKSPARFSTGKLRRMTARQDGTWKVEDPFSWRATQVPSYKRRQRNRRRNRMATASRRANR